MVHAQLHTCMHTMCGALCMRCPLTPLPYCQLQFACRMCPHACIVQKPVAGQDTTCTNQLFVPPSNLLTSSWDVHAVFAGQAWTHCLSHDSLIPRLCTGTPSSFSALSVRSKPFAFSATCTSCLTIQTLRHTCYGPALQTGHPAHKHLSRHADRTIKSNAARYVAP